MRVQFLTLSSTIYKTSTGNAFSATQKKFWPEKSQAKTRPVTILKMSEKKSNYALTNHMLYNNTSITSLLTNYKWLGIQRPLAYLKSEIVNVYKIIF